MSGAPALFSTGVILNVTPRITGDDRVYLEISQEVSSSAPNSTSGINSPTIHDRSLQSALTLKDGGKILEKLTKTGKNSYSYEIIESPLPVKNYAATLTAKQLALNEVYGRLVLMLNRLAVAQADGTRLIAERLTHREMANRLGCSREMVSRLMKDLEAGGFVQPDSTGLSMTKALPMRW